MGYGARDFRALYENINCNLMQDLLRFVTSDDPNDHLSRVYATNTAIVPLLLVTLGAFEDDTEFTRFNLAQQTNRQWRSSRILPKGTNLAIIKYSCADGDDDLLFLFNERPLQLVGCQANGLCKQAFVVERFSRFLNGNCDEIYCSNSRE
jgi:multiple inositol-polyphosphate phosphatase/2,3-bisphosphoglycerate 3-phosphatase